MTAALLLSCEPAFAQIADGYAASPVTAETSQSLRTAPFNQGVQTARRRNESLPQIPAKIYAPVSVAGSGAVITAPRVAPPMKPEGNFTTSPSVHEASAHAIGTVADLGGLNVKNNGELPVDLVADTMEYDEANKTVTAIGKVEVTQGKRILKAGRIVYHIDTDEITAREDVILMDEDGSVHFMEEASLNQEMKRGFVKGLQSYLADGGRFKADSGERDGKKIVMHNARYTPCECDGLDEDKPTWQIRAERVTYHTDENRISYKNAKFEVLGTPILWTPYLSHPDGKIKRKSGFLSPGLGFDSQMGTFASSNYYWAIAPDRDMTVGAIVGTDENPVGLAEYRRRWTNANLTTSGSLTSSSRTDSVAGRDVIEDGETRGHLFADGSWDMTNKWRSGVNIAVSSDDQYLRQYDFSNEDVLESQVYAERFSNRDYFVGRAMAFQDVRVGSLRAEDQPGILPEMQLSLLGDPNATLGGRWSLDASLLGLQRDGNGKDMNRLSTTAAWQRRFVSGMGLVNTVDAGVRGDAYYISDNIIPGQENEGRETRAYSFANVTTSYPLVKAHEKFQTVLQPTVAVKLSPRIKDNDKIPNEDSNDVQLDALDLFEINRFPGLDRIEDGSHMTYGMRTGFYGYEGSFIDFFLGQSYRFDNKDNPFGAGSGLATKSSDVVGQIAADYAGKMGFDYRFQLESESLSSERHEVDAYARIGRLALSSKYLYAKTVTGVNAIVARQQIHNGMSYKISNHWGVFGGASHDLSEDNSGLRRAYGGVDYFGCCLSLGLTVERNLTDDASGDSGTDVMFRVGLKGMGEYKTSTGSGYADEETPRRQDTRIGVTNRQEY